MNTLKDIKIAIIEPCTATTTINKLIMKKHIAKISQDNKEKSHDRKHGER